MPESNPSKKPRANKFSSILIYILFFATIAFGLARYLQKNPQILKIALSSKSLSENHKQNFLSVAPQKILQSYKEQYTLQPDRRFKQALLEIDRLFNQNNNVKIENQIFDSTSRYPDFDEAYSLLLKRIEQNQTQYSIATAPDSESFLTSLDLAINKASPRDLFSALDLVAQNWSLSALSPKLVQKSAHILVLLYLNQFDQMNLDETICSRAMALLALAESLGQNVTADKALLASLMEYSANATNYAKALPENDFLRLTVENRFSEIIKQDLTSDSILNHYFFLNALLKENLEERYWDQWFSLPPALRYNFLIITSLKGTASPYGEEILSYLLHTHITFDLNHWTFAADDLQELDLFINLDNEDEEKEFFKNAKSQFFKMILNLSPTIQILQTQKMFDALNQIQSSGFWDAKLKKDFYETSYLGLLYNRADFLFNALNTNDPLSVSLSPNLNLQFIKDFQKWSQHLGKLKSGKNISEDVYSDVKLNKIGTNAKSQTIQEYQNWVEYGSASLFSMIQDLIKTMDSRPSDRILLKHLASDILYDLRLREDLNASLLKDSFLNYPSIQSDDLIFKQDREGIRAYLQSNSGNPKSKLYLLESITYKNYFEKDQIIQFWKGLADLYPMNPDLISDIVINLKYLEAYDVAETIARKWLDTPHESFWLEDILVAKCMIDILLIQNRPDELQRFVDLIKDSGQLGATIALARVYEYRNDLDSAEKYFDYVVKRYPEALPGLMAKVEFYWRHDRFEESVQILKKWPFKPNQHDLLKNFAKPYVQLYKNDKEKAQVLWKYFLENKIPNQWLTTIHSQAEWQGIPDLSFFVLTHMPAEKGESMLYKIQAYKALLMYQTPDEALKWAKANLPWHGMLTAIALQEGPKAYSLMWDLDTIGAYMPNYDAVQLARTLAVIEMPEQFLKQAQDLKVYYQQLTHPTRYDIMGKYILGLTSLEALYPLMGNPHEICEVAYYLGLKAKIEKRYNDANDWFRISVETGSRRDGEYRWSYDQLYKWNENGTFMEELYDPRTSH